MPPTPSRPRSIPATPVGAPAAVDARTVLEASSDLYFVLQAEHDAHGRIVDFSFRDINAAAAAAFGRKQDAFPGRRLGHLLGIHRRSALFRGYASVAETGNSRDEEVALKLAGMPPRRIRQQVIPVAQGIAVLGRYVSERPSARRNRAFLQTLVDSLPLLVYAKSARPKDFGQLVIWNKAAEAITGYTEGEVLGRTFSDAFPRELTTPSVTLDIRVLGDQTPVTVEHEFPRRDGSVRTLRTHAVSVPNDLDRAEYIFGISEDVTEHKAAQEALQLASAVFEHTTEAIIVSDADDRILRVNRAFSAMTGYAEADVAGRAVADFEAAAEGQAGSAEIVREAGERGSWTGPGALRRREGNPIPCWRNIACMRNDDGEVSNYVRIVADITVLEETREELEQQANHDALTGLPNRRLFHDRLGHALERAERAKQTLALLFVDLDGFKAVNDEFGHSTGDLLLKEVASRLSACARKEDTVCRLGGDEFTVIMEASGHRYEASVVAQRILDAFAEPFRIGAHALDTRASIGIALYPDDGRDTAALLKCADAAMYRAKELGKSRYHFHADGGDDTATQPPNLESELAHAIAHEELFLVYQPIVDLATGRTLGLEALVRWQHPSGGLRLPDDFIPVAEESGLIVPLGEWVLRRACAQMHTWKQMGFADFRVWVNVSAYQFQRGDLVHTVEQALAQSRIESTRLGLELTESATLENLAGAEATVLRLKAAGIAISIDDFGTGYASLRLLRRIRADVLKIDRAFVRDVTQDPATLTIVRAIMLLGRALKMGVVAEGVETREQLDALIGRNCSRAQGYYFSRPVPPEEIPALLEQTHWARLEAV